jgi:hypothetical protein
MLKNRRRQGAPQATINDNRNSVGVARKGGDMLNRFLAAIGLGAAAVSAHAAPYAPYADAATNRIYHWLFCDDLPAFRPQEGEAALPWKAVLFASPPQRKAVEALAVDRAGDSRVRLLAYQWLRAHGAPVPRGLLLGVIVEVALSDGLDTLAAYADGEVRYLNHSGRMLFVQGRVAQTEVALERLLAAAQRVVDGLEPSRDERLPPPPNGNVRLSFLVSDGLYYGEGGIAVMQADALAGPLFAEASALLAGIVELAQEAETDVRHAGPSLGDGAAGRPASP